MVSPALFTIFVYFIGGFVILISLFYFFLSGCIWVDNLSAFPFGFVFAFCVVMFFLIFVFHFSENPPIKRILIFFTPLLMNGTAVILRMNGHTEIGNMFFQFRFWVLIPILIISFIIFGKEMEKYDKTNGF